MYNITYSFESTVSKQLNAIYEGIRNYELQCKMLTN